MFFSLHHDLVKLWWWVLYSPRAIANAQGSPIQGRKDDNNREPRYAFPSRFRYHQKPDAHAKSYLHIISPLSKPKTPPAIFVQIKYALSKDHKRLHGSSINHQNLLAASAEVTTGGRGHLDCGVVISPKGGSAGADRGVYAAFWHDRALSALCLSKELAPGELAPLLRRAMRTCSGDIEACIGCET